MKEKGSPHRERWETAAAARRTGTMRTITEGMEGSVTFLDGEHSLGQGHKPLQLPLLSHAHTPEGPFKRRGLMAKDT